MKNTKHTHVLQDFLFHVFEGKKKTALQQWCHHMLFMLILGNILFALVETIPKIGGLYSEFFSLFQLFSVFVFLLEYAARVWSSPLRKDFQGYVPFIRRPLMLVDASVLGVLCIHIFSPIHIQWIQAFRLIRIFRMLKMTKYIAAFRRISEVIIREKEELIAIIWIMMATLCLTSSSVYLAEQSDPNTPFTSIPASIWWGIATITTVGYGDMVPITNIGKILGSVTSLVGVGIFALPTGLLGASFYHDIARRREKQIRKIAKEIEGIRVSTSEEAERLTLFVKAQDRKMKKLRTDLQQQREKNTKQRLQIQKLKQKKKEKKE